jgi:hypothetical protein
MLTRISGVTAAIAAILNAIVLLGWWNLTTDQITAINIAVVAVGTVIHSYFNPNLPGGPSA